MIVSKEYIAFVNIYSNPLHEVDVIINRFEIRDFFLLDQMHG